MELYPPVCRDAGIEPQGYHVVSIERLQAGVRHELSSSLPVLVKQADSSRKKSRIMELADTIIPSSLHPDWLELQFVVVSR